MEVHANAQAAAANKHTVGSRGARLSVRAVCATPADDPVHMHCAAAEIKVLLFCMCDGGGVGSSCGCTFQLSNARRRLRSQLLCFDP